MEIFKLFGKIAVDNSEANRAIDETVGNVGNAEPRMTKALKKIGAAVVAAFAVDKIKDFGKACISAGMDFDSQMSTVAAISGATGEEFEILRAKAQEMGATTAFSATESAQAMEYMAMAGWKTTDITNGLAGVMNLAAASGEDLATTSDIVTDAMTAFGMSADQSTYFADVLAQTATNANTNVGMMGETFKYVAPLAGAMGYNIEDMSAAIGLMANAGIKGSQSGTSLRNIITNLASPTDKVAGAMDDLGISLTDSDGKTKSFGETLSDLRISFADLDEVQKTQYASAIAGKEGMSGLLALINSSDEDFDKLTDSIKNCTGASEKMAEIRLDNLEGDVTLFKSALEGAQIAISDKLTPVLRNLVEKATDWLPTVQDKLLSAIDVVMDIGKYLAQELTPILSSIGKSVLPIIKDALKSAKAIIEQLVPVIKNIWKFAEPVFKIVVDTIDLIVEYLPTLLQDVLDFIDPLNLIHKETSQVSEEYLKMADNANKMSEKLDDIKQKNADIGQSVLEEYNHYGDLADRLSTVVDKNGKIKEHCEYTVQQIIDELNPALDTSLEIVDGQLKGYKEIADEIDNIILKKQAESMLEKGQENYDKAIADRAESIQAKVKAESEINELEKELDDLHAKRKEWDETGIVPEGFDPSGYCGDIQRLEENINHLNGTVETETQNINKANNEITKYSDLRTAALEGNIGAMQRYAAEYSYNMLTAGNATVEELDSQYNDFSQMVDNLVEAQKKGDESVTDEMINTYTMLRNISHDELTEAQRMANEQGVAAAEKFGKGLESSTGFVTVAARTVAESAEKELDKDTTSHGANFAWGFSEGMRSQIDSAISAAREVGNAAAAALQKALDEHSPSRVTRKMGQFFGLGFSEGIIDEESNTIKTTQQYADSAVNALKSGINNRTPMKPMDFAINTRFANAEAIQIPAVERTEHTTNSPSNTAILNKLNELIEVIKGQKVYLDSGALVGEIAPAMDGALGNISRMKRRGLR
ncbi:MAG: phage tail tape measure protein [Oscillospiraceae bacterium]